MVVIVLVFVVSLCSMVEPVEELLVVVPILVVVVVRLWGALRTILCSQRTCGMIATQDPLRCCNPMGGGNKAAVCTFIIQCSWWPSPGCMFLEKECTLCVRALFYSILLFFC